MRLSMVMAVGMLTAITAAALLIPGAVVARGTAKVQGGLGFCRGLPVTILGTQGPDILRGTPGSDVIKGLGGIDVIRGRAGNDVICAGQGNDDVFGGGGADTINGEGGLDQLYGEAGPDHVNGGPQNDEIYGDVGNDTLNGGAGYDQVNYIAAPRGVNVEMGGGASGWGLDVLSNFESLLGSEFADVISGTSAGDEIAARGGDDLIYPNSVVHGFDGVNTILGGEGDDTVTYANANASIGASRDDDGYGRVVHDGGPTDFLYDVEGIRGSDFSDSMSGGELPDRLEGGFGPDTISGGSGDDSLSGGDGLDTIYGELGDDFLDGGPDSDTLDGGGGADTCIAGEALVDCEA